jgi:HAD superfamily hydrolase (TIGR01509 family)
VSTAAALPVRLRAALLDLDGVLISTEQAVLRLWRRLAARRGLMLSDDDLRAHALGCAPEHTVDMLFPAAAREAVLAEVRQAERDLAFSIMPGAPGLLRKLARVGLPLALVTGASPERVARVLETLRARDIVRATVTWGEASRGKPDPEPYLLAAGRLGVEPERCLVLEDSPSGVTAAVAAGARCVGVGAGPAAAALRAKGAAAVVARLGEICVLRVPEAGGRRLAIAAGTLRLRLDLPVSTGEEVARWPLRCLSRPCCWPVREDAGRWSRRARPWTTCSTSWRRSTPISSR